MASCREDGPSVAIQIQGGLGATRSVKGSVLPWLQSSLISTVYVASSSYFVWEMLIEKIVSPGSPGWLVRLSLESATTFLPLWNHCAMSVPLPRACTDIEYGSQIVAELVPGGCSTTHTPTATGTTGLTRMSLP